MGDGGADALQDEAGRQRGVQGADAVDDGVAGLDGGDGFGVGGGLHFLAVRVDVPDSRDGRGEGLVGGFGKLELGGSEGGEGAGEGGVFDGIRADRVMVLQRGFRAGLGWLECCGC